jgi:hypothetical protein
MVELNQQHQTLQVAVAVVLEVQALIQAVIKLVAMVVQELHHLLLVHL